MRILSHSFGKESRLGFPVFFSFFIFNSGTHTLLWRRLTYLNTQKNIKLKLKDTL